MNYNFIEIGTSDFDTLIQQCPEYHVGLSIEPIKYYLDRLPNKPNVKKIQAAVSDKEGFLDIYYIPDAVIQINSLPWWVRGSNSVNHPHLYSIQQLGETFYNSVVNIDKVPTITWPTLIRENAIESIEFLKIDTEGHDHIILNAYFDECEKNPKLYANKITFEALEGVSDLEEIEKLLIRISSLYSIYRGQMDITLTKIPKHEKAFVLYATESYKDTVQGCVNSLNEVSDIPIFVYMLNSSVNIVGATTINWQCTIVDIPQDSYIDRLNPDIYKIMIQRPAIVLDCLNKYADVVAYVDADSVATKYAPNIFNYFPINNDFPYFVEGIYQNYYINGRGELTTPALELFEVDNIFVPNYRQTGYFVAGQECRLFLEEWDWMCNHPKILQDPNLYAGFHEETILQVLLQKENINEGLPLIYVNSNNPDEIYSIGFSGITNEVREWLKIPAKEEELLFYHGEKKLKIMNQIIEKLNNKPLRIMFIASHLSTGGGPQFLLKRIQALRKNTNFEISVIEYNCYGLEYVVQRNKIHGLVGENFFTLWEDKSLLFDIIKDKCPDIIHLDNVAENFDEGIMTSLYDENRNYKIVETCHDILFDPTQKVFHPDAFAFCTPYHLSTFDKCPTKIKKVIEYPIDVLPSSANGLYNIIKIKDYLFGKDSLKKKHVLSIGLWAPWKNQEEGLEIARKYPEMQFHFVGNLAPNFEEYWKPLMENLPENVTLWGEREDISNFLIASDIFMFNSTWECNPIVLREAISYGLPIIGRNLPQYEEMFTKYLQPMDTDLNTIKRNYTIPEDNISEIFANKHIDLYKSLVKVMPSIITLDEPSQVTINQHFVNEPFLEIQGESSDNFLVEFFDEQGVLHYKNEIKSNHWVKMFRSYFTKWTTKVWRNGTLFYKNTLDYTGKRVYIAFDSQSLGDTIAWMPYVLEFQEKHKCHVVVSTYKNFLFEKVYPELEFVNPGTLVNNLSGMYKIGWFYDKEKEPTLPNTIPLQQAASNILGLSYHEIAPRIDFVPKPRQYAYKYIAIATNSTSGCKFWPKKEWQLLVNYLISIGYKVINVSEERNPLVGVDQIKDCSLENTMHVIHHSEFFIGLSSGLSWLAWAINKHVVMISNFTEEDHEFSTNCTRITNPSVCHGCWNKLEIKFDKGDYNWCPFKKGTPEQFICHTSISAEMVLQKIKHLL